MRQNVGETPVVSHLELLHCACRHDDLEAWIAFQQSLEGTVLSWFHEHPGSKAVCQMKSERHFVALAFERLRQAIVQRKIACETLSEVLMYFRASLNGAILEDQRVSSHPRAISSLRPDERGRLEGSAIWNGLQALLPNQREHRLAYLLYQCGLEPAEIVRSSSQEWSDIQEVVRLRRSIFARLING